MPKITRLDEVSVFGGRLAFLIPHEWVEVDDGEENTFLYQYPNADSGWFRVSLNTLETKRDPATRIKEIYSRGKGYSLHRKTGNRVLSYDKDTENEGTPLHIYFWLVANVVRPDRIHEAIFSYTILRARIGDKGNRDVINVLNQIVSQARFQHGSAIA